MAVITEINGISTSGTTGVNNLFGSGSGGGGGGGITIPAIGTTTGIQMFGKAVSTLNPAITSAYNRTEVGLTQYSGSDFIAMGVKKNYATAFVVTNDGKLWYNTTTATYISSRTVDGQWHEDTQNVTGTSGDWTWVSCDDNSAMAIRGGDICFMGYGNYRQRGDGSTSSSTQWIKTYDGSSDPAVRCYLNYRVAYIQTQSGKILSTGYRYDYQTGENTASGQQANWTDVTPSGVTVTQIACGYRSCKFLDGNGDVWSFGDNLNRTSGPLYASNTDLRVPTQSTNNQQFAGATWLGGFDGDMYMIVDSSGDLWIQGEAGSRMSPDGSLTDRKDAWYKPSIANGTFSTDNLMMPQGSQSDNLAYLVRNDGSILMTGTDAQEMTATQAADGNELAGNPPYATFTDSANNVYQAIGNVNRYLVTYGS